MKKTAILVLDFINDIVHEEGKIASYVDRLVEHKVIENANRVIQWGRQNELPILHVKVGFSQNYIECPESSPLFSNAKKYQALQLGAWGTEFHEAMDVQSQDKIIIKHRVSAFYATDLETVLRAQGVEHLVMCGVATNMAVETAAREAHDRDYQVTVIKDACETANDELQQGSLMSLERIATVISSNECAKICS